jgi:hypothetical protein
VLLAQAVAAPKIAVGAGLTVTSFVAAQAPPSVYDIVTVPAVTPHNVVPLIVAIAGLLQLHTPPGVGSVYPAHRPTQMPDGPDIGPGKGEIVTVFVTVQPMQLPVE